MIVKIGRRVPEFMARFRDPLNLEMICEISNELSEVDGIIMIYGPKQLMQGLLIIRSPWTKLIIVQ